MKIYLVTDFEGVSGITSYDTFRRDIVGDVEERGKAVGLWVREVNAAIRGARNAGAGEIVVLDNHSSGDTLPFDQLEHPAHLIHGRRRPTWLPLLDSSATALVFVGQHAMAGTRNGHLCHTYSRRRLKRVVLNGREIGEFGLAAGIAGEHGVPAVYLSGDDKATEEARMLVPGVSTTTVKVGLSTTSCVSFSRAQVEESIELGVRQALSGVDDVAPLVFETPIELHIDYHWKEIFRVVAKGTIKRQSGHLCGICSLSLNGHRLSELWDRFIGLRE